MSPLDALCLAAHAARKAVWLEADGSLTTGELPRAEQPLTERQELALRLVEESIAARGTPPTHVELARAMGSPHGTTGKDHLENLERKGWICRAFSDARGIRLVRTRPVVIPGRSVAS